MEPSHLLLEMKPSSRFSSLLRGLTISQVASGRSAHLSGFSEHFAGFILLISLWTLPKDTPFFAITFLLILESL